MAHLHMILLIFSGLVCQNLRAVLFDGIRNDISGLNIIFKLNKYKTYI